MMTLWRRNDSSLTDGLQSRLPDPALEYWRPRRRISTDSGGDLVILSTDPTDWTFNRGSIGNGSTQESDDDLGTVMQVEHDGTFNTAVFGVPLNAAADLRESHLLVPIKFIDGDGDAETAPAPMTGWGDDRTILVRFASALTDDDPSASTGDYVECTVTPWEIYDADTDSTTNADAAGIYWLAISPQMYTHSSGSPDLSAVAYIQFSFRCYGDDSAWPVRYRVGRPICYDLPSTARPVLCFHCDAWRANAKTLADLLRAENMTGTFYGNPVRTSYGDELSVAELQQMEADGHCLGIYGRAARDGSNGWGRGTESEQIEGVREMQSWMRANGLTAGQRHLVIGGTDDWNRRQWELFMRDLDLLDTVAYNSLELGSSPLTPWHMGRYHGVSGDIDTAEISTLDAMLDRAVAGNAMMHVLIHPHSVTDLTSGGPLGAWLAGNVAGHVSDDDLLVCGADEAYQYALALRDAI